MKIVKCSLIPRGWCVNLFGTFWAADTDWLDSYVINHERIHTAQQRELLFIPFYLLYLIEFCVRWCQYRNRDTAYRNISFEREAYTNGPNLDYLTHRPHYSWLRYLHKPQSPSSM
ncbi:MAG: hypothetical protein K2L97_01355 [Muribaculaceae bacterium]|nr:hypothetical protein [Muribaculaceae bacterium]